MSGLIHWFEIPALNFERACKFYEAVLGGPTQAISLPDSRLTMALLPGSEPGGLGGAIVKGNNYVPTETGTIIYLNGGSDLNIPLQKVPEAGGEIILPKTSIGENGYVAHFLDSEGNRIALHSSA